MNLDPMIDFLNSPGETTLKALFESELVVWVDWKAEDDEIVNDVEAAIQTGKLSAEWVDADNEEGCTVEITHGDQSKIVDIEFGPQDRHLTIVAMNELLQDEYDIRFCIDSNHSCTLAFVPLSNDDWKKLEAEFGELVAKHFYHVLPKPNLFTDATSF